VQLEEQERLALPEHLNSRVVYGGLRVGQSLIFCVMFCRYLFAIAIAILLRFMTSDYAFGIFKRFFFINIYKQVVMKNSFLFNQVSPLYEMIQLPT